MGLRLDVYLCELRKLPHSRSQIKRHIEEGHCWVNGEVCKPSRKLHARDFVEYRPPLPQPWHVLPEDIPLTILYEDDHLIVLDKQAGLVVHPGPGHRTGTLASALLAHCEFLSGVGGRLRPGIVHRLDRHTSGVMIASKTDACHEHLKVQFKDHTIERRYVAVVCGRMAREQGTFDTFHGRHPTRRKLYTSKTDAGRRAVTHFRVLNWLPNATVVEAALETGRTPSSSRSLLGCRPPVGWRSTVWWLPEASPTATDSQGARSSSTARTIIGV